LATSSIGREDSSDFIPHSLEDSELFLFISHHVRRIIKREMMAIYLSREHRTHLVGISTHGDDGFHLLVKKLVQMLGSITGNIDAYFCQSFDGERMHITRWL
jgi:hypothetical protein